MAIKTAKELAAAAEAVAKNYKTLYVMGCFGAPMTTSNKARYIKHHSYNSNATRAAMINAATADTFGFDCVCFIKGLLWGWNGNKTHIYGGATYASNGVPDIDDGQMISVCSDVSTNFNNIAVGEVVWMQGHIGIYIGNGLAVECTPKWKNNVQITACNCNKAGYNRRDWTKHGKLPYVKYTEEKEAQNNETYYVQVAFKDRDKATAFMKQANAEGFDAVIVDSNGAAVAAKTIDEMAQEVILGKWGSGATRKEKLTAAGYNYAAIQKRVNELLKG